MNLLLSRFGYLRIAALILTVSPLLVLPVLGLAWLWQNQWTLFWLAALLGFGLLGYFLHWLDTRRTLKSLAGATNASPDWPAGSAGAWERVEALAQRIDPDDWALDDASRLLELGRLALDEVARHYHPGRERPLLELTVPHALLITERASRDLRLTISEQVPFSHQLTLGSLARMRGWSKHATRVEGVYRAGRALVDPFGSIFRELSRGVGNRIVGYGSERLRRWLLQEYVRKIGYYGVELYSGHLLLSEPEPSPQGTENDEASERLRILVLGRSNSGKSSLINGLFGEMTAIADPLADSTRALNAYRLEREGQTRALVFDTPGIDSEYLPDSVLKEAVTSADLILWVTAAPRPDRGVERMYLERISDWLTAGAARRRPAPLIVAVSHIDQLSPVREWAPPYDLNQPNSPKARTIKSAMEVIASDFGLATRELVPVCLAEGRHYNVDDGLWAAIIGCEDEARRARFLRLLPARQRAENWGLVWRQLVNTGRLISGRRKTD
ncbi:GTPase [Marinimicrobium sp. ABcell2]|uniref:GTPase n=1 Tax=Marinimicrobium sp. ABcell2 TaxID=3069751 RepID=UPI0027AF17DB|nr:GTPase [Marinimicrobium sp. ABcell2]MDQ2078243.1 GTPase [Marinimicrobium sp. ABcell2]